MSKAKSDAYEHGIHKNHPQAATSTNDFVSKSKRAKTPADLANEKTEKEVQTSDAADKLIEEKGLNVNDIVEHTGKTKIGKPEVDAFLASLEDPKE